jgi:hypothetical protein
LGVEIPKRIVRESRQVNYRIETLKIARRDVADVFANGGELTWRLPKSALLEEAAVEPDDFVPRIGQ